MKGLAAATPLELFQQGQNGFRIQPAVGKDRSVKSGVDGVADVLRSLSDLLGGEADGGLQPTGQAHGRGCLRRG